MIRPRRSAVALRHVAFEDLGLLAPIMEREGWDVSFCEAAVDDLTHRSIRNADLVISLGGPIGAYETPDGERVIVKVFAGPQQSISCDWRNEMFPSSPHRMEAELSGGRFGYARHHR